MGLVLGLDVVCRSTELLPMGVKGLVKRSNGVYYIYINAKLSEEEQCKTVAHELDHITSGDLDCEQRASLIEMYNHKVEVQG